MSDQTGIGNLFNPKLLLLYIVSTFAIMSGAAIAPAQPMIAAAFSGVEGSDFLTKLVLTIPAFFIAIGSPIVGAFVDKWNIRSLLITSLAIYGIAGSSAFIATSLMQILVLRAIAGLSVAGIMVSATTLLGSNHDSRTPGAVFGFQSAFIATGAVLHSLAGGLLTELGWRFPFLLFLLALVAIPLALLTIKKTAANDRNIQKATSEESKKTIVPQIIWLVFALALVGNIVFYLSIVQTPFLLSQRFQSGSSLIGIALAVLNAFSAAIALLYGRMNKLFSFYWLSIIQIFSVAVACFLLFVASDYWIILVAMMFFGIGQGLLPTNLYTWINTISPDKRKGTLIGGVTSFIFLGQFISPIVFDLLKAGSSIQVGMGWVAATQIAMVVILGIGGVIRFFLSRREARADTA